MQEQSQTVDFYLGAIGANGFCGYFDQLSREGRPLHLLKGGAGCGKSTMLRRVCAAAQGSVQNIHCASDPASLDAVVLAAPYTAALDATPPHALEPNCVGAVDSVISLYHTLNCDALRQQRQQICQLTQEVALHQECAAHSIASAACLLADSRSCAASATDHAKVRLFAGRTVERYLPHGTGEIGKEELRLLSAITPTGIEPFAETVPKLAETIVVLHDEYGIASRLILETLRSAAKQRGHAVITCVCSVSGLQKPEHLIFPDLKLAFVTSNYWHTFSYPNQKNIHCTRFENKTVLRLRKKRLRFNRRAASDLFAEASVALAGSKKAHDALEKIYAANVDFSAVDGIAKTLLAELALAASQPC